MTTTVTNNVPRLVLDGYEISDADIDRCGLDYARDSDGILEGTFVKYKGWIYDLGEFMRVPPQTDTFKGWDGYFADTFFSAVVVRYCRDDNDRVIMGVIYS